MYATFFLLAPLVLPEDLTASTAKGQLQGVWIVHSDTWNGWQPDKGLRGSKWLFKDHTITINPDGVARENATYRILPKPPGIDITNQSGGLFHGIYRLNKDQLEICYALRRGQDRPSEFKSSEGSNTVLIVLKREAK